MCPQPQTFGVVSYLAKALELRPGTAEEGASTPEFDQEVASRLRLDAQGNLLQRDEAELAAIDPLNHDYAATLRDWARVEADRPERTSQAISLELSMEEGWGPIDSEEEDWESVIDRETFGQGMTLAIRHEVPELPSPITYEEDGGLEVEREHGNVDNEDKEGEEREDMHTRYLNREQPSTVSDEATANTSTSRREQEQCDFDAYVAQESASFLEYERRLRPVDDQQRRRGDNYDYDTPDHLLRNWSHNHGLLPTSSPRAASREYLGDYSPAPPMTPPMTSREHPEQMERRQHHGGFQEEGPGNMAGSESSLPPVIDLPDFPDAMSFGQYLDEYRHLGQGDKDDSGSVPDLVRGSEAEFENTDELESSARSRNHGLPSTSSAVTFFPEYQDTVRSDYTGLMGAAESGGEGDAPSPPPPAPAQGEISERVRKRLEDLGLSPLQVVRRS